MPIGQTLGKPEPASGSFERRNLLISQTRKVLQAPSWPKKAHAKAPSFRWFFR